MSHWFEVDGPTKSLTRVRDFSSLPSRTSRSSHYPHPNVRRFRVHCGRDSDTVSSVRDNERVGAPSPETGRDLEVPTLKMTRVKSGPPVKSLGGGEK